MAKRDLMDQEDRLQEFAEHVIGCVRNRPDEIFEDKQKTKELQKALASLEPRTELVIDLYFGLSSGQPMTYDSIGIQLSLSRSRIQQIKEKGIRALRRIYRKTQKI